MRKFAAAAVGVFLLGCDVPEYRIRVTGIPQDTVKLQVATYLQGSIATDTPSFALTGPPASFTFGLDLPGVPENQAVLSVAARGSDNCLLAVGTTTQVPSASDGSTTEIPLAVPNPPVTSTICAADPPVILAVLRSLIGPLHSLQYSLAIQGWGFQPTATVEIHSAAVVECAADSLCLTDCLTPCDPNEMGPGSGTCRKNCTVIATGSDVMHDGPARIQVNLDPTKNALQSFVKGSGSAGVRGIGLLDLLGKPLTITVTNPDHTTKDFTEVDLSMPGV